MSPAVAPLLEQTTCPHCWQRFEPHQVLWIAAHPSLVGDVRLGRDALRRFLPTRFNLEGAAVDAAGRPCHDLACPACHLPVPRAVMEMEPLFVSVLGTPACGKSYFLATMAWELRRVLANSFKVAFADADPSSNRVLTEYEEALFLSPQPRRAVPLADLIRKTELQGELYNTVLFGDQAVSYPRPFLFTAEPSADHPNREAVRRLRRLVALYDNAGEHFLPGADSVTAPVSRHLPVSKFWLYLFDPTQDPRFGRLLSGGQADPAVRLGRGFRQETVLTEAANRIRRYAGLGPTDRLDRPLLVVATKKDVWEHLLDGPDADEPWVVAKDGLAALDAETVERCSRAVRDLIARTTPELIAAAEGLSSRVTFLPVSALGCQPEPVIAQPGGSPVPGVRPGNVQPRGVVVPFLYGLAQSVPGLIPLFRRPQRPRNGK